MRRSRFTEQQIIGFLKQAESGLPVKNVCRQGGFRDPTFDKWRAKYGGIEADDARRLKDLAVEDARLKKPLPEVHLDLEALKVGFGVKREPRKTNARPSPSAGTHPDLRAPGLPSRGAVSRCLAPSAATRCTHLALV